MSWQDKFIEKHFDEMDRQVAAWEKKNAPPISDALKARQLERKLAAKSNPEHWELMELAALQESARSEADLDQDEYENEGRRI